MSNEIIPYAHKSHNGEIPLLMLRQKTIEKKSFIFLCAGKEDEVVEFA